MENSGIEWQTTVVAMAVVEGRERERERGDERKLKREKLKEIQIFKLGFN